MKVDLFLPESNVVMLKLEDATNLKRFFEMHHDHHMATLLGLFKEDEWNVFQAMVLEGGTFKAQVKNILHHHTDIKVKEYKGDERINTLKDK
ncbi:hypothetical protein GBA52_024555 [Prunus armeniaca]|nr:hypothetical protein GBA52_024555 [Prunus armeniaca]